MSLKFEAEFNRKHTTLNHVFGRNNVFCKLLILRGHYNKPIGMKQNSVVGDIEKTKLFLHTDNTNPALFKPITKGVP